MMIRRTRFIVALFLLVFAACLSVAQGQKEAPAQVPAGIAGAYDVKSFGARGDGKALDTPAINQAIEAAAAAGGGTVRFPAGTYLSYSIHLKSRISLYLEQGATILAADPPPAGSRGGYDPAEPNPSDKFQDFGHSHWHNSLIWGEGIENVAILGQGMIYGKGLTREGNPRPGVGNKSIALKLCRNVTIRDISILQGGHFGILATGVDNLTIDNLRIDTNRDGINIDCCRNVRISNCSVNSPWDDAICLKSSYGLGFARATENVTITNCQVSGYDQGTFLDGTFSATTRRLPTRTGSPGASSSAPSRTAASKTSRSPTACSTTAAGWRSRPWTAALLEDVTITNITMRDIVNAPIFLRLGSRMRGPEGTPVGALRRVILSNITVYNADPRYASIISGIPGHDIEDVKLSNIRIFYQGGGTKEQAALAPPERENDYPEPRMFGEIPAYGFFIRHVKGIELSNVEVSYLKEDLRPAFVLWEVRGADFQHVKAQHAPEVPTFVLKNIEDFSLHQVKGLADVRLERAAWRAF